MPARSTLLFQTCGLLIALLLLSSNWFSPVQASSTFLNGQNAGLVLGQPDFVTNPTNGTSLFSKVSGVAIDPINDKLFVADTDHHRVLRFGSLDALTNGAAPEAVLGQPDLTTLGGRSASQTGMYRPRSLVVDSNGALWVADVSNRRVLRFDDAANKPNGAPADGLLGSSNYAEDERSIFQSMGNIAVEADGTLWVADYGWNRVLRFDDAANKPNGAAPDGVLGQMDFEGYQRGTTQNSMYAPYGLAVDTNGTLWVSELNNNRILRFDNAKEKPNGANADGLLGQMSYEDMEWYTTSSKTTKHVRGLAVDANGTLWASSETPNRVVRYDNAASKPIFADADGVLGAETLDAQTGGLAQNRFSLPYGLAIGPDGSVWVADSENNRVLRFYSLADQTIQFDPLPEKIVDESPFNISASASSDLPVAFSSDTPSVCSVSGNTVNLLATGTCTITASQAGDNTFYSAAADVQQSFPVKLRPDSAWATLNPIHYGTALSSDQLNATSSLAGTFSYQPALGTKLPIGTHTLTVTFSPQNDAYGTIQRTVELSVTKAPLTITAQNANRKYGEENPSFSVSYSGFVNGEDTSVLSGTLSISSTANISSSVGSYPITSSGLSSDNYEISYIDGSLEVTKAPLTISAQNASRVYGEANPSFGVSYNGFVNGEDESVLGGALTFSSANASSPVGSHPIVPSGLTSNNYAISFVDGTLSISKAPLTITVQNASRKLGEANPSFTVRYSGFVNGEDESVLGGTLIFNTSATPSSTVGSYPIRASGLSSNNYAICFVDGSLSVGNSQIYLPLVAK